MLKFEEYFWFMDLALEEAQKAYAKDEVPVGAVLVDSEGKILSKSHNLKEKNNDPCGHAEILALTSAGKELGNWRLKGATLFVTLEPCPMCMMALIHARINKLVFGAYDSKGGAISLGYQFQKDSRLNHSFSVVGGMRHFQASNILSRFFREKRAFYKKGHSRG